MTTFALESPRQNDVIDLLERGEVFARSRYPVDSCYLLDVDELEADGVSVFVARDGGDALGMVALVDRGDGSGEIKRLFVHDRARGRGVAGGLLDSLEAQARSRGIRTVQLETGTKQPEAVALYEKHGYRHIPNFGQYVGDETSICMEKELGPPA